MIDIQEIWIYGLGIWRIFLFEALVEFQGEIIGKRV